MHGGFSSRPDLPKSPVVVKEYTLDDGLGGFGFWGIQALGPRGLEFRIHGGFRGVWVFGV